MDWTRRKFTPEEEREIMTRHMQFYRWMLVLMVCVHADPQVEQPKLCLLFRGSRGGAEWETAQYRQKCAWCRYVQEAPFRPGSVGTLKFLRCLLRPSPLTA